MSVNVLYSYLVTTAQGIRKRKSIHCNTSSCLTLGLSFNCRRIIIKNKGVPLTFSFPGSSSMRFKARLLQQIHLLIFKQGSERPGFCLVLYECPLVIWQGYCLICSLFIQTTTSSPHSVCSQGANN